MRWGLEYSETSGTKVRKTGRFFIYLLESLDPSALEWSFGLALEIGNGRMPGGVARRGSATRCIGRKYESDRKQLEPSGTFLRVQLMIHFLCGNVNGPKSVQDIHVRDRSTGRFRSQTLRSYAVSRLNHSYWEAF